RKRFLRHARPWWDMHRHRLAPQAAERIEAARTSGQLRILAGRVTEHRPAATGVDLVFQPRTGGPPAVLHADAVFECRGRSTDVTKTDNPLLGKLFAEGLA